MNTELSVPVWEALDHEFEYMAPTCTKYDFEKF